MKWLTLEYIKQHSRIDYDIEDDLLELYADSAEQTVLSLTRRSVTNFYDEFGEIPSAVVHATLMLVDASYQQRSPVSTQSLSAVPYAFDLLLKPYIRLSGADD